MLPLLLLRPTVLLKPAAFACSLDFAAGGKKGVDENSLVFPHQRRRRRKINRATFSESHSPRLPSPPPNSHFLGTRQLKTPAVACLGGIRVTTDTTHTHNTKGRRDREGGKTKPSIISTFTREKKESRQTGGRSMIRRGKRRGGGVALKYSWE